MEGEVEGGVVVVGYEWVAVGVVVVGMGPSAGQRIDLRPSSSKAFEPPRPPW